MNRSTSECIATLISKPPSERSDGEIDALLPMFSWRANCLRGVEKDIAAEILKNASHQKCNRDDIVVRQGDTGENFYIILRGSVSVYITLKTKEGEKVTPRKDKEAPTTEEKEPLNVELNLKEDKELQKKVKKKEEFNRSKFGQLVAALGDNQSFGELALIFGDRKRNASIISDEETDLVVIPYHLFNKTIKEHAEKDLEKKMDFIQSHPFFSKWSPEMQRMLQGSLKKSCYGIGGQVVKQGDKVKGLHFLIRGRALLTSEPGRHPQQFPKILDCAATCLGLTVITQTRSHNDLPFRLAPLQRQPTYIHMSQFTQIKRMDGYAAAEKIVFDKICDLCSVAEGEVLDDLEILLGLDTYIFTVTCVSTCETYTLNTKMYERLIMKKNPYTLNIIKLLTETKLRGRLSSSQGKKIPLLSNLLLYLKEIRVMVIPDPENVKEIKKTEAKKEETPIKFGRSKTLMIMKSDNVIVNTDILRKWYLQNRSPFIQPLTVGALYYREMVQRKAKLRLEERKRLNLNKGDGDYRSLNRKIKDSFITGLKEKIRVQNTLRRVSLMKSITEEHWR